MSKILFGIVLCKLFVTSWEAYCASVHCFMIKSRHFKPFTALKLLTEIDNILFHILLWCQWMDVTFNNLGLPQKIEGKTLILVLFLWRMIDSKCMSYIEWVSFHSFNGGRYFPVSPCLFSLLYWIIITSVWDIKVTSKQRGNRPGWGQEVQDLARCLSSPWEPQLWSTARRWRWCSRWPSPRSGSQAPWRRWRTSCCSAPLCLGDSKWQTQIC